MIHFIAGLPRSGSTLLSAILRQNHQIDAGMSSPVGGIFCAVQGAIGRKNEAAVFLDEEKKYHFLRSPFLTYYAGSRPIIFDTNRVWPSKLAVLARIFPHARMICCVREPSWIVDSIERLIRSNPYDLSSIFGFESGETAYGRAQSLCSTRGIIGFSMNAIKEAFYGEHADRLVFIEYEALCRDPGRIVRSLCRSLGIDPFEYDYDHIEQLPNVDKFDEQLATPGLHRVAPKVEWRPRETILPPDLFNSFGVPFWRQSNPRNVPVVHYDEAPKLSAVPNAA